MAKYLVNLSLDGYESEEDEAKAGLAFIEENLDFSGSSVSVKLLPIGKDFDRATKVMDLVRELEVNLGAITHKFLESLKEK